ELAASNFLQPAFLGAVGRTTYGHDLTFWRDAASAKVRRMNLLFCVCALLLAAAPATNDARFEAFAQTYVQELLDRDPETATRLGEHRNDARLNDYSAQGVKRELAAAKAGLTELSRIDPGKLSAEDAVDYRILKNRLESQVYELETLRGWAWN